MREGEVAQPEVGVVHVQRLPKLSVHAVPFVNTRWPTVVSSHCMEDSSHLVGCRAAVNSFLVDMTSQISGRAAELDTGSNGTVVANLDTLVSA